MKNLKKNKNMKNKFFIITVIACISIVAIYGISSVLNKTDEDISAKNTLNHKKMHGEIALPSPSTKGTMSVEEALNTRRSIRDYTGRALTLEQVSQLLWATYGVTKPSAFGKGFKTAPSAGATYPLEIYLLAGNVENLQSGLYRYNPDKNTIKLEKTGDMRKSVASAALGQRMLEEAPASIVFSAIYKRTTVRYGKRGEERYVCMDLGHAAQNTYLQATAMNLGTCAIGAFNDDELQKILALPAEEKILYLMPVGYKK